jgi:hypothetical protein
MAKKSINIRAGFDMKAFSTSAQNLTRSLQKTGKQMKSIGKSMSMSLTAPIAGLAAMSVINFDKQAKSVAQVEAGLKSTGGAVGFVSKELQKMASDLQSNSLFGDEEILQNVTSQLLTFTNVTGEAFKGAQQVVLDYAARTGRDLLGTSVMIGKALNDPVLGLAALGKAGVQFTVDQKNLIKGLVEGGDAAGAQAIILKELENQYGGSAAAAAAAGSGPFKQMSMALGDLSESFGEIISEYLAPFALKIKEIAENLKSNLSPQTKKIIVVIAALAAAIGPLIFVIGALTVAFTALDLATIKITVIITVVVLVLATLVAAFIYVKNNLQAFKDFFYNAWVSIANGTIDSVKSMLSAIGKFAGVLGLEMPEGINAWLDSFKLKARESKTEFKSLGESLLGVKKQVEKALPGPLKIPVETVVTTKKQSKGKVEENLSKKEQKSRINDLKTEFAEITQGINAINNKKIEPVVNVKGIKESLANLGRESTHIFNQIGREMGQSLTDGLKALATEGLTQFGEFLGSVLTDGGMTPDDFGRGILDTIGQFMQQFGSAMIALGVANLKLGAAIAAGPAGAPLAIGAGVALVAAGAALSQMSKKGIGNTDDNIGPDPIGGGANFGSQAGEVNMVMLHTRISGRDLILVQERETAFTR